MPWTQRWIVIIFGLLLIGIATIASADDVVQGRALYLRYCASCHGLTGEGNGPVAGELKTPPADLRLLWKRYGTPLPEDQIVRFIDGRAEVEAHGKRDMPVWAERFYPEMEGNERRLKDRIRKFVAYLQSIQTGARHASVN